ncbi:hypothetical protein ESA_02206 [Cronobacter sakazakii ATCC BAA-894]|uniref:Uncharacterized protein n=1 Tax=Cronobacter sakazakii (strain ATCC BAA-894) TaxID=290339 RepID=A7MFW0_CROS8|nr:hypothetical protein ESA_02206 [Cronobacter sakazakii ATCC BAA-894]
MNARAYLLERYAIAEQAQWKVTYSVKKIWQALRLPVNYFSVY